MKVSERVQLLNEASLQQEDVAIIITHHQHLPHLDALIKHNPDADIYLSENNRFEKKELCWHNADLPIYDFFKMGFKKYDRYVFLEYDVYCTMGVREYYREQWDKDFVAQKICFPWRDHEWYWFRGIPHLPLELENSAMGIVPLGCFMMSGNCLQAVCELMELYEPEVFCELRLATLAMKAGYQPVAHHCRFGRVAWDEHLIGDPDLAQPGFYHPLKERLED